MTAFGESRYGGQTTPFADAYLRPRESKDLPKGSLWQSWDLSSATSWTVLQSLPPSLFLGLFYFSCLRTNGWMDKSSFSLLAPSPTFSPSPCSPNPVKLHFRPFLLWSGEKKPWISEKPLWGIFRKNSGPVASPGWSGPCKLRESAPAAHLLWAWTPFLYNKW